jgi:hypothetical protein
MKAKLMIVLAFIAISNSLWAQTKTLEQTVRNQEPHHNKQPKKYYAKGSVEDRAHITTNKLTKQLNLNEREAVKVYNTTLIAIKERESVKATYYRNKKLLKTKMNEVDDKLDKEYQSIFTSEIYLKYQANKAKVKKEYKKDKRAIKRAADTIGS